MIIRGSFSGAGALVRGTGFTVVRQSLGYYKVTFTTPFAAAPVVVATSEGGGSIIFIGSTSVSLVELYSWNLSSGVYLDSSVHFHAMSV